jgi:phenylpropionate dioxygenase-like ring-hydroxylating dioxygenase large terminal subunit
MSTFQGAPWLIAHKSMISSDRPRKISLHGHDYVLWKDRQGRVKALPNACPHMGAMLSEGWCDRRDDGETVVRCPFHALGFDGEGCTILPERRERTRPQLQPLPLIERGDFIWTYGGEEPRTAIPEVFGAIENRYQFMGYTADMSVETPLLSMLLNMHDYNHQNGTHRPLFKVRKVQFDRFVDDGHHSHAFYDLPTAPPTWREILKNPEVLMIPKVVRVHMENLFPCSVIFHADTAMGKIAQLHLFIPESDRRTRTFVLLYARPKHPWSGLLAPKFLEFAKTITEQDADILGKIYSDAPRKMKLNNEVGMDWVKRNSENWPEVREPNLSKTLVNV